jgi:hypothetical protein
VEREGENGRESPCDLFFEPLRNKEGRLDRNARVHANLQIQVENAMNARKKKAYYRKEVEKEKAKSRVFHLDVLVTVFIVFIIVVFVIILGLIGDFFLDSGGVDVDGSLILGVEFVVHGKLTTTHESSNLLDILLDKSLRLMQALFEGFEGPVAVLLEAVCEEIEQLFLADTDGLFLLLLDRLFRLSGFDETAEGLVGLGVGVDGCVGAGLEAGGAFWLEHFHEALVSQTAVLIVLDSSNSHLGLDEACESGLF